MRAGSAFAREAHRPGPAHTAFEALCPEAPAARAGPGEWAGCRPGTGATSPAASA